MKNKLNKSLKEPVNKFDLSDLALDDSPKIDTKMSKEKRSLRERVQDTITVVEDFPRPGISFKDITTFLNNTQLFNEYIEALTNRYLNYNIEYIVGIESRGFIFGAALAFSLKAGLVLIRKKGKLPGKKISQKYTLEYGQDELEINEDAFHGVRGARVILIDDLIATGGSANASLKLINKIEGKCIELCTLISLKSLENHKDRVELKNSINIFSLIEYEK